MPEAELLAKLAATDWSGIARAIQPLTEFRRQVADEERKKINERFKKYMELLLKWAESGKPTNMKKLLRSVREASRRGL